MAGGEDRKKTWPPPSDLVSRDAWDGILDLPTDVALKSSSYEGSVIARLHGLQSEWIFSWPEVGQAPFMEEAALLAGEEFDALVFNALTAGIVKPLAAFATRLRPLSLQQH